MNKSLKKYIIISSFILLFSSCSENKENNSMDKALKDEINERAKKDAVLILETDSGTMAHEIQILEAHATAERLRQAGDTAAANLYIKTVREIVEN